MAPSTISRPCTGRLLAQAAKNQATSLFRPNGFSARASKAVLPKSFTRALPGQGV